MNCRTPRDIQNHLLPKSIPQVKDYEIAGVTQPVRYVGGDYYDVVRINETQTVLCIADVSGKGMPAALLMSSLQAALRPLMWDTRLPRELCRRLNRIFCEIAPVGKFISFFYAVLDSKESRLTYCNAGHSPPVLMRANGTACELNAAGAVLGQFPDWVYEQSDVQLRTGDRLMMFTDGLIEACDQDDEPFGEGRLITIARESRTAGADGLTTLLMQAASEHCGGRFQDDASMIVLRVYKTVARLDKDGWDRSSEEWLGRPRSTILRKTLNSRLLFSVESPQTCCHREANPVFSTPRNV